jgi:hypothetical protein
MKKPESTMSMVLVTPEKAREWLKKNTNNRSVSSARVKSYSDIMRADDWTESNASIMIGKTGELFDGQHRLMAVVQSGKSVWMWVAVGVDEGARCNIDIGMPRRAAAWLQMNGVKNASCVATALRLILRYEQEDLNATGGGTVHFTPKMAMDMIEAHPEVTEFAALVKRHSNNPPPGIALATMCAYGYLFSRYDYDLSIEFVKGMAKGYNPNQNPAFHKLREMIIRQRGNASPYTRRFVSAFMIQAWNAERKGEGEFKKWNGVSKFPKIEK